MLHLAEPIVDVLPEWTWFLDAVISHRPEHGTACESWTVRDIVAHNAGNAEELARILARPPRGGSRPHHAEASRSARRPFASSPTGACSMLSKSRWARSPRC